MRSIVLGDTFEELLKIESNSIDLILTDPPYFISRDSGFKSGKSKKYNIIDIDFGEWDKGSFDLDFLFREYYRVLKKGGTLIFFYDIWKSTEVKQVADFYKFKQPRVCQWVKTNPVPVNSSVNYLSNSTEYFFTFVKDSKPTFNSKYDNGLYSYPICHGKERTKHPTQKPLSLIDDLIQKHSNPNDLVLDTFGGSGTTAVSCVKNNRNFIIIEKDLEFYNIINDRINNLK